MLPAGKTTPRPSTSIITHCHLGMGTAAPLPLMQRWWLPSRRNPTAAVMSAGWQIHIAAPHFAAHKMLHAWHANPPTAISSPLLCACGSCLQQAHLWCTVMPRTHHLEDSPIMTTATLALRMLMLYR